MMDVETKDIFSRLLTRSKPCSQRYKSKYDVMFKHKTAFNQIRKLIQSRHDRILHVPKARIELIMVFCYTDGVKNARKMSKIYAKHEIENRQAVVMLTQRRKHWPWEHIWHSVFWSFKSTFHRKQINIHYELSLGSVEKRRRILLFNKDPLNSKATIKTFIMLQKIEI